MHMIEKRTVDRARLSLGASDPAIYARVAEIFEIKGIQGGTIADIGCGSGLLRDYVGKRFNGYVGVDIVRYDGFPNEAEFKKVNLDTGKMELEDHTCEVVASVETIEHLENPRAFVRELVRILKPGGVLVLTTPNQLSILSKLSILLKNKFVSFQERDYPAHISALLEIDLLRMARENNLREVEIYFSHRGRIALTPWHYPNPLSRAFPRAMSDNVLLFARSPK